MLQQKQKDSSVFKVFMPLASNKNEGERSHIEYYDTYRISFDLDFPVSKEYKGTEGVIKTINNGIKESHKEIKELKLTFLGEL
ncbi:hypothetical protein [Candidatus Deianiraea vastatrix]|uniref:Uncharacterized protein n=1 Tax=Candidatus Deianiraea vastatrix TaxID=2163644 RepID=A0A5B8XC30_9RICK|nr:hypothetical protein [Candidatus Deianiraea vastatrix]QED22898.1 hypothetical protein Deia_00084 [Candidatus Deianiraea vastatrix]